ELIQADGLLYEAFQAAEMDGTEQVLGLVQTVAILLGTAQVTRGASLVAEGTEAVFLADKMIRGFFWGAYMATAENAVAVSTGEVRTERETIGNWTKDAVSTGTSMALVMPAAGSVGQALEGNALKNLAARYLNPGGLVRLAGDTGLETLEEAVDQQLRKTLDGKSIALSAGEIKELFKLCLAGGGIQIGALAKNFQGQVEIDAAKETVDEKPLSRKAPHRHPLLAPMWMLMGVDGLGGFGSDAQAKPAAPEKSYRELRKEFLDGIVQSAEPGQKTDLVSKVLEHSVEDGLELADRLKLGPSELQKALLQPKFALKHSDLMLKLIKQLRQSRRFDVDCFLSELRDFSRQWPSPDSRSEENERRMIERLSKMRWFEPEGSLFDAIEDFYLDAFMMRKPISPTVAKTAADSESPGRRMARRYLEELEPLFEGKATAFRQIQEVKQAVVEQELKAELKQAHPDMRVELDAETDLYRLVVKEAEAADSKPDPIRQRLEAFEARAVEELERLLDQGSEGGYIAKGLAGLDSKAAWDLRKRLLDEGRTTKGAVVMGLAGLDSPPAWEMRESFLFEVESKIESGRGDPTPAGLSLASLDSPRAWEMRDRILSQGGSPGSVAAGLSGLDSRQAWDLRRRLLVEGAPLNLVALGLAGLDSTEAWDLRKHFQSLALANDDKSTLAHLVESLAGLDSPQAWKMRHEILNISLGDPTGYLLLGSIVKGLAGLDSQQAWEMRL
ncbi:MAG TPA: hypothetical protein VJP40_09745, partial [bacterium]|nr:hypothetical protein [bacterium]